MKELQNLGKLFLESATHPSPALYFCVVSTPMVSEVFSSVLLSSVLFNIVVAHTIPLQLLYLSRFVQVGGQ